MFYEYANEAIREIVEFYEELSERDPQQLKSVFHLIKNQIDAIDDMRRATVTLKCVIDENDENIAFDFFESDITCENMPILALDFYTFYRLVFDKPFTEIDEKEIGLIMEKTLVYLRTIKELDDAELIFDDEDAHNYAIFLIDSENIIQDIKRKLARIAA